MFKCEKQATHNFPILTIQFWCYNHKTPTMKNIVTNICKYSGCIKTASFNWPDEFGVQMLF